MEMCFKEHSKCPMTCRLRSRPLSMTVNLMVCSWSSLWETFWKIEQFDKILLIHHINLVKKYEHIIFFYSIALLINYRQLCLTVLKGKMLGRESKIFKKEKAQSGENRELNEKASLASSIGMLSTNVFISPFKFFATFIWFFFSPAKLCMPFHNGSLVL